MRGRALLRLPEGRTSAGGRARPRILRSTGVDRSSRRGLSTPTREASTPRRSIRPTAQGGDRASPRSPSPRRGGPAAPSPAPHPPRAAWVPSSGPGTGAIRCEHVAAACAVDPVSHPAPHTEAMAYGTARSPPRASSPISDRRSSSYPPLVRMTRMQVDRAARAGRRRTGGGAVPMALRILRGG
jgi:hypothetical protein